ncbi:uncharacterized protein LOC129292632 [Prosopis cineraria]|uniref:uncharacterized protein LOC129292632 n=1 Tax=Prosopis cineraria TaxID=364024 RepID=UPI00240ED7B8|nr:uncharacterized protein LOC129292632 [Prosopis cineraria]
MGIAEYSLIILIISLSFISSSSSVHNTLSSELKQESKMKEGQGIHAYKVARGGASGGHASGHPSSGHSSPHNGENGGNSKMPVLGAAVIPAYVAGAAGMNNRHHQNHHGTSNGSFHRIEFPTLLMIAFLYTPLLHLCLFI